MVESRQGRLKTIRLPAHRRLQPSLPGRNGGIRRSPSPKRPYVFSADLEVRRHDAAFLCSGYDGTPTSAGIGKPSWISRRFAGERSFGRVVPRPGKAASCRRTPEPLPNRTQLAGNNGYRSQVLFSRKSPTLSMIAPRRRKTHTWRGSRLQDKNSHKTPLSKTPRTTDGRGF